MNMSPSEFINLKVFLRDGNHSEARRFSVDLGAIINFTYMREKLMTMFPSICGRDFKITWIDMDGDEITISSDEDLVAAFVNTIGEKANIIYVTVNNLESGFMLNINRDVPYQGPMIICDVCNQVIAGFRYKCVQCPDYDLCGECEHKGNHSDHFMIRVPNNEIYSMKHARKFMHHLSRYLKKSACAASKEAYLAAKCASKAATATATSKPTAEGEKPSSSNEPTTEGVQGCPLENMARQHLAPFLEALQNQQPSSSTDSNQPNQNIIFDIINNAVNGFFGQISGNDNVEQKKSQSKAETPASSPKESVQTQANEHILNDEEMPLSDNLDHSNKQQRDPGWTFVATNQTQKEQNTLNEKPEISEPTAPTLVYHENPIIAEGLVQLHEMGFSNNGGVLAHLLERFDGSVAAVVREIIDKKL